MNKIDCINQLTASYKQEIIKNASDLSVEYAVTNEWLIEQYTAAFKEGLTQGLNWGMLLKKEQKQFEKDEIDSLLKNVFDKHPEYTEIANKINFY